jgi:hypothetical protein
MTVTQPVGTETSQSAREVIGMSHIRRIWQVCLFAVYAVVVFPATALAVGSNIGPAPQLRAGGLVNRYLPTNYQLDQYYPAISASLLSGVGVSDVPPMIAFFIVQGDTGKLPSSDSGKSNGIYTLEKADEPAAVAMGKGGQYQRLLLSIVILLGEIGAFLLLGALALGMILAQLLLLLLLSFAPVALLIGIFPGSGHDFFRGWLGKLAGYLARKMIYSLILAVTLAVSQAFADATSNLGWLLAFAPQATFLWIVSFSARG